MDEALKVHGAAARVDRFAIPVKFENISLGDKCRRNAACQKEPVGVLIVACADVSEGVDNALVGQNAVGVNEVFNQLGIWRTRCWRGSWRLRRSRECPA